ncbi:hypothetical protein ACFFX1_55265 [Dactylosporangium sucinum]|uniref:Uncharacterized protein n=1 Tax=Dactylosporangium sucinum TaxID=1424081 RepID=A0A917U267_9ACTN|nr:hypothetical protein [Dactylosporangium sucinum]GGM52914.1 hypothetical protein GCM10007977_063110 [Dactylosporangium sucinum]
MSDDDRNIDYDQIAKDQEFARAFAAGETQLTYDDTAPIPELPPAGAPVMVVRPIRLPFDADQAIQDIAARRGMSVSALLRDWILADLEADQVISQEDPAVVLRGLQAGLGRVIDNLTAQQRQHRNAA